MDILLLIVGLALILVSANFLTEGAAALAQRLRVPEFIIGLTVIAVGTSMPEMVVSVLSSIAGKSDVAIGNVVGSNLFNVLVILGICALIRPVVLTTENIRRDIPAYVAVALVLVAVSSDRLIFAAQRDTIGRIDGVVMILLYIGVMWVTVRTARASEVTVHKAKEPPTKLWLVIVMIAGSLAGLIFGGQLFLDSATSIARRAGISESLIAITLVAGGTSLPELAAGVVSLLKGKAEMALGNVIGSCVANILLILGISAAINPLTMGGITPIDILMVLFSSLLLLATAYVFRRKEIDRWEGILFLAVYAGYIWYLLR